MEYFYDHSVLPFEEIKRKIEAKEEPYAYVYGHAYGEYEPPQDPPFLDDWEHADFALDIIGETCLGLVQKAFHAFLKEFVLDYGGEPLLAQLSQLSQFTTVRLTPWSMRQNAFSADS